MRTSAYIFSQNRVDFEPDQLDTIQRTFERAWSTYLVDRPSVWGQERAQLREQLAAAVFETAKYYLDPTKRDDSAVERLKRLALARFLAHSNLNTTRAARMKGRPV